MQEGRCLSEYWLGVEIFTRLFILSPRSTAQHSPLEARFEKSQEHDETYNGRKNCWED